MKEELHTTMPEHSNNSSHSGYIYMAMNVESKCMNLLSGVIKDDIFYYTFLPFKGKDMIDPTTTIIFWNGDPINLIEFVHNMTQLDGGSFRIDERFEHLLSTDELLSFKVNVSIKDKIKIITIDDLF